MTDLEKTLTRITEVDVAALAAAQATFDAKTKPRGSLGRLEELGCRVSAIRAERGLGSAAIVVAAADHGVADEGVSAYPAEVTAQMVANFCAGGAAINVLARGVGAQLVVVDVGVRTEVAHAAVRSLRIAAGTMNAAEGPAMTLPQAQQAIASGIELAGELDSSGIGLVGIGEMGIGNSTSAAMLAACLLQVAPSEVCGRGTGVDDAGLKRKIAVIERALAANRLNPADPLGALAAMGGFEIAFLVGLILGASSQRMVVVLDGFITSAAALIATRLSSASGGYLVAAHLSPEPGHRLVLTELGLVPLLDLGLRLGEGSGAALALPLVNAAAALLEEMATFASAGVSDTGR